MLSVVNVSKSFGGKELYSGVTFNVGPRDRIALIGPNGYGKSTLFGIIAREILRDSGVVTKASGITVGYLKQEITPSSSIALLDDVMRTSSRKIDLAHRMQLLQNELEQEKDEEALQGIIQELGGLQQEFEAVGGYDAEHEAKIILSGLGFKEEEFHRPLREFSGGWVMRATIAKLFMTNPDILLLDEPTNHLDIETSVWFEDRIKKYQGAILLTSHDRSFLNNVAKKIISIESDDVIFYNGSYDEFVVERQHDLEVRHATVRRQELKLKKEMRFIERFRSKATKASQVQSRLKQMAKEERILIPRTTPKVHFTFPDPPRSGSEVITLSHVRKSYGEKVVYEDLNLVLNRGDKAALVGVNGAGKSTLLKVLAGVLLFDEGERKLGHNVNTAYYAQHQLELLDPENSALEELQRLATEEPEQRLRGVLGAFLFRGDDVYKKVAVLSGGERARLSLAKMLLRPANFLLMDEPTNHLDIASREILSDALSAYNGTLCFITHDRTLIREIASKIIDIRNGVPVVVDGKYDDYLEWKEKADRLDGESSQFSLSDVVNKVSPKELQRQKKAAEGELRNSYYRASQPLKSRIEYIESKLTELEEELKNLEAYLSRPSEYGSADEIRQTTRRHQELRETIADLTKEWEKVSLEAEEKLRGFETDQAALEAKFRVI